MAYTNSPLVSYTKLSPNCTKPRNHVIDTITPHCVVGQSSAQATLNLAHFVNYDPNKGASCNYAIGYKGEIGMGVEEKNRSWCSSNRANDHRAITIEIASDAKHPYAMKTVVYESLINLCVDICKRNGKTKLLWLEDKTTTLAYAPKSDEMVLTAHRWFENKECPGDWLYSRFGNLAEEVTKKLGGSTAPKKEGTYAKGSKTKLSANFNSSEFDCHGNGCCTETLIDPKLVEILQKIRNHFGKAITITSGYRCPTHNSKVSRAKNSYHTKGQAADFTVSGVTPREVAKYAESIGIKGIGLYETKDDGFFVHIDTRTTKAFWYGQSESPVTTFGGGTTVTTPETPVEKPTTSTLYRVRKSWTDAKSQLGAYKVLSNAKKQVDKNPGYYVFDEKGNVVYPTTTTKPVAPSTPVSNADEVIWKTLKGKGLNDFAIAGIMGNLFAESALNPKNLQNVYEKSLGYTDESYTAAVDNGTYTNFVRDSAGYGLAQWTYWSRKQNLLDYAKRVGKSIGDLHMQIEFLWTELQNYKSVMNVLKSAKSIKEASDIVLTEFERPANMGDSVKEQRASFGKKYYDKYANRIAPSNPEPIEPAEPEKPETPSNKEVKATDYAQHFNAKSAGSYRVTAKGGLNIRHGAGTHRPSMKVLPYGTVVQNFGYYTYTNGVSWMYVVAIVNGVRYIGFCSRDYLIKV